MDNNDLDPQLLEGLRKGDRDAQSLFWKKFHNYLYVRVAVRIRSPQDAEEIVTDICLRVFESIGTFRGKSRFTTWLYTLMKRAIVDFRRSPKNRAVPCHIPLSEMGDQWVPPDGNFKKADSEERQIVVKSGNPELTRQVSAERRQRLYAALRKLSPDHYQVILCRTQLKYSVKKTATHLNRTEAAVKMLYQRASETLRKVLNEDSYFSSEKKGGIIEKF